MASSLARLVRATYAALVERVIWRTASAAERRHIESPDYYRDELRRVWRSQTRADVTAACRLDMARVQEDIPRLARNPLLVEMLIHTQQRLGQVRHAGHVERCLLDQATERRFLEVEYQRKGARARLPETDAGKERRGDFGPGTVSIDGLDYR